MNFSLFTNLLHWKIFYRIFSVLLMFNIFNCSAANLDLTEYKGKVVYIDFWATWCNPCLKAFPWMSVLETKFSGKNFVILIVNVDTDIKLAEQFLQKHPLKAVTIFDSDNSIAKQFNINAMPTSFIFDTKGELVEKYSGFNEQKTRRIEEKITHLLN